MRKIKNYLFSTIYDLDAFLSKILKTTDKGIIQSKKKKRFKDLSH